MIPNTFKKKKVLNKSGSVKRTGTRLYILHTDCRPRAGAQLRNTKICCGSFRTAVRSSDKRRHSECLLGDAGFTSLLVNAAMPQSTSVSCSETCL